MRLIDADALPRLTQIYEFNGKRMEMEIVDAKFIDNAPTIDAVPVVRCKDCFLYGECKAAEWYGENGNGYCSVGGRRKDHE